MLLWRVILIVVVSVLYPGAAPENVEREVMRGALDILSGDRVRTAHMEAMIDAGDVAGAHELLSELASQEPVNTKAVAMLARSAVVNRSYLTEQARAGVKVAATTLHRELSPPSAVNAPRVVPGPTSNAALPAIRLPAPS